MDFSSPNFWLSLAQAVITAGVGLLLWARRPGERASEDLSEQRRQTQNELATLKVLVTQLQERQAAQESVIVKMQAQQERRIERVEDFFMMHFGSNP